MDFRQDDIPRDVSSAMTISCRQPAIRVEVTQETLLVPSLLKQHREVMVGVRVHRLKLKAANVTFFSIMCFWTTKRIPVWPAVAFALEDAGSGVTAKSRFF